MQTDAYPAEHQIIIGRDREREQLHAALARAINGQGSLVLISGEAGIGKTTLVTDLTRQAREQGALVLAGGCYDLTTTPPYGPWVELTRSYPASDDSLPDLPEQLSESSNLAGIGSPSALFDLIRRFLVDVRSRQPLVLVLEDFHWADSASLELVRYLGRACTTDEILLAVTYRDDELTRRHPLFQLLPVLAREADAVRIELQHLSLDEMRELAIARGLAGADADRLAAYLEQRTSGNPLFATELLRALETESTLTLTADGAMLGELDERYLPAFVLQIIERRLVPLETGTRRALEVAAVIGQEVSFAVWQAVSDLDQAALDVTIEQALAAHVLEETPDRRGLRFTHALIREVLYDGVIPTRRRIWHQCAAEALIAGPDPDPDTVAYHLEQADDPRLVDWLVQAGERAERRQARLMAAERFDQAQMLLWNDPDRAGERAWLLFRTGLLLRHAQWDKSIQYLEDAEVLAMQADRPIIAYMALAHQGLPRYYRGDVRQGLEDMRAGIIALESLDAAEQDELQQLTARISSGVGVQGRGTLGLLLMIAGRIHEAKELLESWPESEWEKSPDAYRAMGGIYAALGQPAEARQALMRSSRIYAALGDPGQAASDLISIVRFVHLTYEADNPQDRLELIRAAQPLLAQEAGIPMPEGRERYAELAWTFDYILSGEWDRADEILDQQMAMFTSADFDQQRALLALHRGDSATAWDTIHSRFPQGAATVPGIGRYFGILAEYQRLAIELALDAGDLSGARQWLEASDQWLEWTGAVLGRAENHLLWARYYLLAGDTAASRGHADQALEHASDPRQPLALLASHRLLGHLATRDGNYPDAETHLQTSLDLAAACQAPFERALTLLELARLRGAHGQTEEAQQWLAEIRQICEPLKAQPTLEQVAALEAELDGQPAATLFGLTPRELDVLRLVADGLTDPEVAERLFVSPRTVSSHLTSVYTKLGVSSRTAATRLAVEHRLLSH